MTGFNCCLPDDLLRELVFFNTFEELNLPIKGPMEDAEVVKLYEPSPTPCLYVAPAENMVGRVPLCSCFWLETLLLQSLTSAASARILVSPWAVLTQHRWTAGVEAMSTRFTLSCGSSGVASHAWVVCLLRPLKNGACARGWRPQAWSWDTSAAQGGLNLIRNEVDELCHYQTWTEYIPVYTSIYYYVHFWKSNGLKSVYTVFFQFKLYHMTYTALGRYQLLLKHHETMFLYDNCYHLKYQYIFNTFLVYSCIY